ncbi:DUF2357 domain-containing protein [Streptomyces sp. NPDC007983]|uniref:DUF2357 domain-containing protein n=1 Tax=Streptomyces sp. NPDC007983 TaxID=3364800 RepID=UPI0036E24D5C
MNREATEPDPDSLIVRHLLALSGRLAEEAAALDDWLAMPPIILDVSDETEALPVEEVFARESGALRTVCHRPYTRLGTVEEILPTSRVRSIAAGATARLAAHPEDWVSQTLAGVRPRRLLARRSEEDADIYENRVAVAVLNVMRSHLQQRIAKLRDLSRMVGDVHGLLMSSEESSWRARRDLTGLLRNIEDSSRYRAAAEVRLQRLESSLAAVEIMLSSPLTRMVDHRSVPARELHPTNLLSSDPHYRRVALLWQACTAIEDVRPGAAEMARRQQEVRVAFERFTGLLLFLACKLLQAVPEADQPAPAPGRTSRFRMRGAPLTVTWFRTGEFTLHWRERQALRVVPITTDLCTAPDAASVAAVIADVRRKRPPAEYDHDLIVYPGPLQSRQNAEPDVVQAAYGIGHRNRDAPGQPADIAPVSPLDIFSVSRLVRAIQWATLGADARHYPHTVSMPAGERSSLADCGWLEPRPDGVAVVRAPHPEELDRLPTLLGETRGRRGGGQVARYEAQRLGTVRAALEDAATTTELLEVCPMCAKPGAQRQTVFELREGGLFAAACSSCRTRWELRRCLACDHTFPLLDPDGLAAAGAPEPDLDRRVGGTFLAVPCWVAGRTSQAICPACGTCGQEARVTSCPRGCSARAPF